MITRYVSLFEDGFKRMFVVYDGEKRKSAFSRERDADSQAHNLGNATVRYERVPAETPDGFIFKE